MTPDEKKEQQYQFLVDTTDPEDHLHRTEWAVLCWEGLEGVIYEVEGKTRDAAEHELGILHNPDFDGYDPDAHLVERRICLWVDNKSEVHHLDGAVLEKKGKRNELHRSRDKGST